MDLDRTSFSRKLVLGAAGVGSAVVLAMTVGVMPAWGSSASSQLQDQASYQSATIPLRQASITIPLGSSIHALPSSVAVCTLQSDPAGRSISYAKVDSAKNTVTVFLNGPATKAIQVACITTPVNGASVSDPVSAPVSAPVSSPAP